MDTRKRCSVVKGYRCGNQFGFCDPPCKSLMLERVEHEGLDPTIYGSLLMRRMAEERELRAAHGP